MQNGPLTERADGAPGGGIVDVLVERKTVAQAVDEAPVFEQVSAAVAAAEAVGKVLEAPVEARTPEIAEQPPGVIVLVAG